MPTFFLGYLGEEPWDPQRPWRTGDRARMEPDGRLRFEGRADDVIIPAGSRIGPSEVESALVAHLAVADAAVVAAPDPDRGSVVRAVVVLWAASSGPMRSPASCRSTSKASTAPYEYPRIVDWADELPRTASGKIRRAVLREERA